MEEKILVIDDEMHIVELLKFNLEVNGYIVDYSLDSFEGYHKAKELKPNLILLDWMLPNISGIDVLKKIREDEDLKDTPVIMLTAKNMERDKVKGLEEGADDYITKPFGIKEFDLLKLLLQNKGKVLSRNFLLDKVWGYEYFGETRTVDVHIRYLRKKIENDGEKYIETIRGIGYKIS